MENPIKMNDLGVPLFSETSKFLWKAIPELATDLHHLFDAFRSQLFQVMSYLFRGMDGCNENPVLSKGRALWPKKGTRGNHSKSYAWNLKPPSLYRWK